MFRSLALLALPLNRLLLLLRACQQSSLHSIPDLPRRASLLGCPLLPRTAETLEPSLLPTFVFLSSVDRLKYCPLSIFHTNVRTLRAGLSRFHCTIKRKHLRSKAIDFARYRLEALWVTPKASSAAKASSSKNLPSFNHTLPLRHSRQAHFEFRATFICISDGVFKKVKQVRSSALLANFFTL
jgi:hypothetical protein